MNARVATARLDLSLGDPPLYVLVDSPERCVAYGHVGPSWAHLDEEVQRVHVISPSAHGEVRSYWISRGALYHADCHPMDWPEVDAEVSRVTGLRLGGWRPGDSQ